MSTLVANFLKPIAGSETIPVDKIVSLDSELVTERGVETLLDALDARWNVKADHASVPIDLKSRFSDVARPEDFGAVGDGVQDDTLAIQAAIDTGKDVVLKNRADYRITETLRISTPRQYFGGRANLFFDILAGSRPNTRPAIWVDKAAVGCKLFGFVLDHNGTDHEDINERGLHIIWGSGIFIESNDSHCDFVTVINGADNGIAVAQIDDDTLELVPTQPRAVSVTNCRGKNNGCGTGFTEILEGVPHPRGRLGAAVDIGTGMYCIVSDCIDEGSYVGFILDVGAGANCVMNNCYAFETKYDFDWPTETNSGLGFYIGGADSRISNCAAFFSQRDGFWIDATANYSNTSNCIAYACGRHGFMIDNDFASHVGLTAKLNGQNPNFSNTHSYGFYLNGNLGQYQMKLISCNAVGHDYGVFVGRPFCFATLIVPTLDQNEERFGYTDSENSRLSVLQSDGGYFSFGENRADTDLHIFGGTLGATRWGDMDNQGQLFISPKGDPTKRLVVAYDQERNKGVIQTIHAGVMDLPLQLNPNGGDVECVGTFDSALRLRGSWIWVDGSGRLRIKQTQPTSDLDGVVVGTQTN